MVSGVGCWFSSFSPASRIILIESDGSFKRTATGSEFQSRKQDYFNWKDYPGLNQNRIRSCFSPASRIILIERPVKATPETVTVEFQSRKQDYFNWKSLPTNELLVPVVLEVSVPQAGLF